jgi:HlyD family secretion protein
MSAPAVQPAPYPLPEPGVGRPSGPPIRYGHLRRIIITLAWVIVVAALLVWGGLRLYRSLNVSHAATVPVTRVKRGDVTLTVTAKAELRGGHSEDLAAPMTEDADLHITSLRKAGEVVKEGDIVLEFDTTDQVYRMREAEADLAEAEQQVIKAKAEDEAQREESNYALLSAKAEIRQNELEARKNPLLSAITARQNDIALQASKDKLAQLEKDVADYKATGQASIAIQEAARNKAQVQAATARKHIEEMTVRAHRAGYVAIHQNTNINFGYRGMALQPFRVGDRVGGGMVIAEIPDLANWELAADIGELDRGHLAVGDKVDVQIVAVPFRKFHGHIKEIGGTSGPQWNRHFECKIALDDATSQLRPGMNADVVINAETLHNVLSVPGQALFDSDGRAFVYVKSGSGFAPADVKLVRRSESQAVITGVPEGTVVALANPEQSAGKKSGSGSGNPLQALPK